MLDKRSKPAFVVRDNEPDYARLPESRAPDRNRYGKSIELVGQDNDLAGKSLYINGDCSINENPNRYKQHGFYFNADNCISCHACESACSEKNNLPAHLAFRSVGYVEGGTYPAYKRLNISMACNHCDDPVCLKGCPTRAYTKFAEYGAVLQDPDICFGCGYCTWVCPYNAPQLDLVVGRVEKCNMCVDRLEAGLKPACVSACLAGALDFGVIETTPENRQQLATQIPGFPDPEITHPNIRFQQTRSLPKEMTRPDAMSLRYERDEQASGEFKTKVRSGFKEHYWNINKLSSRENPLVVFTLLSQMAMGAFLILILGPMLGVETLDNTRHPFTHTLLLVGIVMAQSVALLMSTIHLGKLFRFYRGFNNLRYSPVSREAATLMVFFSMLGLYTLLSVAELLLNSIASWLIEAKIYIAVLASLAAPVALYFMHRIYRIKARPFWDHWQVLSSFYGTMLMWGSLMVGAVYATSLAVQTLPLIGVLSSLSWVLLIGLSVEGIGLVFHARNMKVSGGEGAASHADQTTYFGKTYYARNNGLGLAILMTLTLMVISWKNEMDLLVAWLLLALLVSMVTIIGRALFYVLVIPTTMPGAFFWRNKGFQEHARETGLAEMPQVGVVYEH